MKKSMTFEQAMARLNDIVNRLEQENIPLEESLKEFSEGAELLAWCHKKLDEARLTVEKLLPEKESEDREEA